MQEAHASHAAADRPRGLRGTAPFILSGLSGGHGIFHWFTQSFFVMLPAVVATFGLSGLQVGAISTTREVVSGVIALPGGVVTDMLRRYWGLVMAFCMALFGIGWLVMGLAPIYPVLLLGMAIVAMAASVWHLPATAALSPPLFPPAGVGPVLPRHRRQHRGCSRPGPYRRSALRSAVCRAVLAGDSQRLYRVAAGAQLPGLLGVSRHRQERFRGHADYEPRRATVADRAVVPQPSQAVGHHAGGRAARDGGGGLRSLPGPVLGPARISYRRKRCRRAGNGQVEPGAARGSAGGGRRHLHPGNGIPFRPLREEDSPGPRTVGSMRPDRFAGPIPGRA